LFPLLRTKLASFFDANNYRAIVIANACSKLLESIMYKHIATIDGYLDEDPYQFGFKRGHSTDLCSYVFKNTLRYYTSRNSHVLIQLETIGYCAY